MPCYSLSRHKDVLVPANLVLFDRCCAENDFSYTTGLASGNNIQEAVTHALYEVIERHIEDIVHWNKVKIPTVPVESINDRSLLKLICSIEKAGESRLVISSCTEEFKIPAFRVFAYPLKGPFPASYAYYTSLGVHLDKTVALSRALTELVQGQVCSRYRVSKGFNKTPLVKEFPRCIMSFFSDVIDEKRLSPFSSITSMARDDFRDDLLLLKAILEDRGAEILVRDLTHPEIGIRTVRVIVRGLHPGNFGVSIVDLMHKAARISPFLGSYSQLTRAIKHMPLT